jgi:hypothetical protein
MPDQIDLHNAPWFSRDGAGNGLERGRQLKAAYLGARSPGDDIHLSMTSEAASIFIALWVRTSRSSPFGSVSANAFSCAARSAR